MRVWHRHEMRVEKGRESGSWVTGFVNAWERCGYRIDVAEEDGCVVVRARVSFKIGEDGEDDAAEA